MAVIHVIKRGTNGFVGYAGCWCISAAAKNIVSNLVELNHNSHVLIFSFLKKCYLISLRIWIISFGKIWKIPFFHIFIILTFTNIVNVIEKKKLISIYIQSCSIQYVTCFNHDDDVYFLSLNIAFKTEFIKVVPFLLFCLKSAKNTASQNKLSYNLFTDGMVMAKRTTRETNPLGLQHNCPTKWKIMSSTKLLPIVTLKYMWQRYHREMGKA